MMYISTVVDYMSPQDPSNEMVFKLLGCIGVYGLPPVQNRSNGS